jgi:3-oxoacyl-[acyl-carrier protein] reductase
VFPGAVAEVAALLGLTERTLGRADVLVNSVGCTQFVAMCDVDALSEAVWDRRFAMNVKGIWLCTKAAALSSTSPPVGLKVSGSSMAYAVSNAAAIPLTKGLAFALAPEIRVNAVAPGLVVTR